MFFSNRSVDKALETEDVKGSCENNKEHHYQSKTFIGITLSLTLSLHGYSNTFKKELATLKVRTLNENII